MTAPSASEAAGRPGPHARVVVVGGGVAGLEAILALHDLAGDRAEVTLVSPEPDFLYVPLLVEEPFGLDLAEQHALAPIAEGIGARLTMAALRHVRSAEHEIYLSDGASLPYDFLVVCVGGRRRPAFKGVLSFPDPRSPLTVDRLLALAHERGEGRIAFVVPPGVTWALPIYELALMTERSARRQGDEGMSMRIITPEEAPLGVFGPTASAAVGDLLKARGIELTTATRVHQEDGEFLLSPGQRALGVAQVVALMTMEGPAIPGLPSDEGGFIPIDEHAVVRGVDDVYAAGDGTSFPVKQGGIATQQADAAALHLAHCLGAAVDPEPFEPVLRGKLLTGGESLHLRADLIGGRGEGETSLDCLWWPPHKISGRYLAPFLYHGEPHERIEAPEHGLDVEVALPREWHEEPMAIDVDGVPPVD